MCYEDPEHRITRHHRRFETIPSKPPANDDRKDSRLGPTVLIILLGLIVGWLAMSFFQKEAAKDKRPLPAEKSE